jgi:DNA-binding protein H-NS
MRGLQKRRPQRARRETQQMSVIGRLDEQVDAVLIAPLDKNSRRTTDSRQQTATPPTAPPPRAADTTEETLNSQNNNQAPRAELPVWLL